MTEATLAKLREALLEGERSPLVDFSMKRVLERIEQTSRGPGVEPSEDGPPTS